MILSMVSVTAYAEGEKIELSVTADKTAGINAGDVVTVKVSVVNFNGALSSLGFNLFFNNEVFEVGTPTYNFPEGFTLSLVTPLQDKGKVAYSSAGVSDATSLSGNLLTVSFTAKTDITVPVEFSLVDNGTMFNTFTPVSPVGKLKEQIYPLLTGDLPVAITAPVKGGTPETIITDTNYTGSITWTPTDTGGKFAANTVYTANVTLTAKEGYQFAGDVKPTVAGATRVTDVKVKNSGKTLEFKAAFAKTGTATLKGIDIITNPALEMAVPTAAPNATATNERSLAVTGVYDGGSGGPVAVNWEITTTPIPKGVSLDGSTLKVTNEAEAGKFTVKASYTDGSTTYTDIEQVTITKAVSKETAIVATAPATTSITVPTGSTTTSGKCSYKVYDQYGAEKTGIGATWIMEPAPVAGVTLTLDGAIAVNSDAKTGTVKLYAKSGALESNKITFNITRETSVATTLTIDGSADSVTVPTVTKPGTTECAYAAYNAIVKDQYGTEMTGQTIEWSVTDNPGVAINNGQLTVTNTATAGNVTITAKSDTLNATKNVTINKDTAKATLVEIYDQVGGTPETRLLIPAGTGTKDVDYTAKVYDQYGVYMPAEMVHWALDPTTVTGVVLDDTSIPGSATLKVDNSATSGTTFKLKATTATLGTTGVKELEIKVQKKKDVSSNINFNDGSLTYKGAGQEYEAAELDNSVTAGTGGAWTYTYAVKSGATGMLDAATGLPKIVGTYTVTATYEDSSNIGSKSATLNITPKTVDIPAPDTTVYTYDGTAKTYKISASADYTVNHATQTNASEAGYTVTVALKDVNNTIWENGDTIVKHYTFIIKKATPTGEPSYTKITAAGKNLADAALAIGTLKPDTPTYQLHWVDGSGNTLTDDTTVVKNQAYTWLFTPADTANYNTLTGSLTPYYVASSGGSHVSKVQKPEITIIGSGKADLSADGRTATITAAAGHELVSVVLNGKEMGKVEKLTGLKTGDKATVTFRAKTDGKAEMDKIIAQKASKLTLMARSKKTAKLNIKVVVKGDLKAITDAGYTVKYKFYRSTKKSAGYKAVLTKKAPTYYNTYGKKGTMYYYKARVMIYDKDGNFVAQTALKQCKYANRLWTK